MVYCEPARERDTVEVPEPVIVVEVLSDGTAARDQGPKLAGYFSLPSVAHYLILDPERRTVAHHWRGEGGKVERGSSRTARCASTRRASPFSSRSCSRRRESRYRARSSTAADAAISPTQRCVVGSGHVDRRRNADDRRGVSRLGRGADGRWELLDGRPIAMAPERAAHLLTKAQAWAGLYRAVERAGLPCTVFPDGATVRVSAHTAFEPDALVTCDPHVPPDAIEIPNPLIVVEVLSESTARRDHGRSFPAIFLCRASRTI